MPSSFIARIASMSLENSSLISIFNVFHLVEYFSPLFLSSERLSEFGAPRKPPRKKHGDIFSVLTIPFTELSNKVSFLKEGANDNPEGPKDVENQAVGAYIRG